MAITPPNHEILPNPDPSTITGAAIDKAVANLESRINTRIDGMEKAVEVFHADLTRVPTSVDKAIQGLREILETRLHCMEEDVQDVHTTLDRRQADIRDQVLHLRELLDSRIETSIAKLHEATERLADVSAERFTRIDTQFIERDKRTDQLSLADKTAVAAALQAAKEAVGAQNTSNSIAIAKSESSTVESIRQLQALFNTANAATNDKINDLKSRLDRGEGQTSVSDPAIMEEIRMLRAEAKGLDRTTNTNDGRAKGVNDSWVFVFGLGSLVLAAAAILDLIFRH
jgi:hypothetical protein